MDLIAEKFRILPNKFSDKLMQLLSKLWPNHLPKRMEQYRDKYGTIHWVNIEMSDEGIDEANEYLEKVFLLKIEGSFFRCTEKEAKKAILHRFVIASDFTPRYFALTEKTTRRFNVIGYSITSER